MSAWLCSFSLIAQWFCGTDSALLVGYIDGDSTFITPMSNARIETLLIERGASVKAGDVIARQESDDARFALDAAEAQFAEAQARFTNLTTGKRAEEIAVLEASRVAAKADLSQSDIDLKRAQDLVTRKMQSQSVLDAARTQRAVAAARLNEIEANLRVATIAARSQEIEAARRVADARRADVERAKWQLDQRVIKAPASGLVQEIIRYQGEVAGPNAPIATLLAADHRKLRVFVPETSISKVRIGDHLALTCDGCGGDLQAEVDFVAKQPEYTPPVLYSVENRPKLVVLVEAKLNAAAQQLNAGQIVDVLWSHEL